MKVYHYLLPIQRETAKFLILKNSTLKNSFSQPRGIIIIIIF